MTYSILIQTTQNRPLTRPSLHCSCYRTFTSLLASSHPSTLPPNAICVAAGSSTLPGPSLTASQPCISLLTELFHNWKGLDNRHFLPVTPPPIHHLTPSLTTNLSPLPITRLPPPAAASPIHHITPLPTTWIIIVSNFLLAAVLCPPYTPLPKI